MSQPRRLACILLTLAASTSLAADPAPNGITLPEGYKDWRLLSVHQRSDNNTLRAVLATMSPSGPPGKDRRVPGRTAQFSASWCGAA